MSTTIYLIRHGQSEANVEGVFAGQYDPALSGTGLEQGGVTAKFFADSQIRPDVIYSSDLKRAYETAQCTAEIFHMPIVKDENLREIHAGEWEKVSFAELIKKFPKSYGVWKENIGCSCCDGGESVVELQKRVVSALTRIAQSHEESVVFVFTHATPIRVFVAHCLNKTPEQIKTIPWATNASVTKVVYEEQAFRLEEYSRDDFMGEMVTKLPSGA